MFWAENLRLTVKNKKKHMWSRTCLSLSYNFFNDKMTDEIIVWCQNLADVRIVNIKQLVHKTIKNQKKSANYRTQLFFVHRSSRFLSLIISTLLHLYSRLSENYPAKMLPIGVLWPQKLMTDTVTCCWIPTATPPLPRRIHSCVVSTKDPYC